jgi:hypothetical protein
VKARNSTSLYWLLGTVLFLCIGIANAAGNFVPVRLPKGVTVELPKNWTALTNNQRITLDSWVQAKAEARGMADATHDLAFAANYYDDQGKTAGMFNIRFYPDLDVTQSEARAASAPDVKELDATLRQNVVPGIEMAGGRLLAWAGTTKQSINGATVFVTEYRRSSQQGGSFRARLVRFFNAQKSFTITISYREDQDFFLRPICDRIISSIRI